MASGQDFRLTNRPPNCPFVMITLKHLNEDTSWLISFKYSAQTFNILVDPWCVYPTGVDIADRRVLAGSRVLRPTIGPSSRHSGMLLHPASSIFQDLESIFTQSYVFTLAEWRYTMLNHMRQIISHEWTDHCHKVRYAFYIYQNDLKTLPGYPLRSRQESASVCYRCM